MTRRTKWQRLRAAGWRQGSVAEYLGLTPAEAAFVELKLDLSQSFRSLRSRKRRSQVAVAKALESSQSRVSKMESGDPTVSIDLLILALLQLGMTRKELARIIAADVA
jgi:predicted transcriptional regulator